MNKAEIQRIGHFLSDVNEGLCDGDGQIAMQLQLQELHRIIKILMDETFNAKDKELKTILAVLEQRAREYKDEIEKKLALRN